MYWHFVSLFKFNRYEPFDGRITERDFCSLLLTYAGFPDKKRALMTRRVKKAFKNDENAKVWFSPLLINSLYSG